MSVTTTAKVDEKGRFTISEDARNALGIDGRKAILQVSVDVLKLIPEDE